MATQLLEAEQQFFLGLYQNAVRFYQHGIEKRTGVQLGEIRVRHYRQIDQDIIGDLESIRYPWLVRLFKRASIKARLQQWRNQLEATYADRAGKCAAAYYNNAIYVSFSGDTTCHEEYLGIVAVHELAHALWEKIAGKPLHQGPSNLQADHAKFKLLVEGYATYAERVWFAELYPPTVQRAAPRLPLSRKGVYFRGMQAVSHLVQQYGPSILLEIPKRWRTIPVDADALDL